MNQQSQDLNSQINRRQFVRGAAALAAGIAAERLAGAAVDPKLAIIDTHTHFYDPTRSGGIPWPGRDDKFLYRPVLPSEFQTLAAPLGATGTVVVECSPRVQDNDWILELAEKDPFIVGLVGNLAPASETFARELNRLAKNRLFRGIRIGGGTLPSGLDDRKFLADLGRLEELDLELDINGGPDMLPNVARLAQRLDKLRIVVNHVANVPNDGKIVNADWRRGMQAVAACPRAYCKVSALVEAATLRDGRAPMETEFYLPILDTVWNLFGADRLIYGSNWPVSARVADYPVVQRIVKDYFRGKGAIAEAKFFEHNSQAAYKWVKRKSA